MMSKGGFLMSKKDPYTKDHESRFTLRISTDLPDRIKIEADKNKRSTGRQIEFILEQYMNEHNSEE